MNIYKFVAPEFIFGYECRWYLSQSIRNLGARKAFIVTDKVVKCLPWFEEIISELHTHNLSVTLYDNVSENPKDHECHEGAKQYHLSGCDILVAIGGGSVLDAAKAIGILVKNSGHISDYEGVDEIPIPIPPIICLPSTAGSAAEISQFSIITNTTECYKMAIVSKAIVPDLAIIDPELTMTKGFDLTIDTGLDVLAHAIESYVSNAASPMTMIHSQRAIELIIAHLYPLSRDLNNREHRQGMLQASVHAGLAFSNASLGLIHAMAHAFGGRYNLIHGQLNGQLLSSVVAYNQPYASDVFAKIAILFGAESSAGSLDLSSIISAFIENIRPNATLPSRVFEPSEMEALIPYILNDPCVATNPRPIDREGVLWLYEKLRQI